MECRVGTNLFGHSGGVDGGTVRISLSLWLCSGGYGTVEMVSGGDPFYFLSSVCCQFFWRLDVCGRNFVLRIFCWWLCSIFSRFLILKVVDFFNNLLQVVSSQSEPRGGSGTSA